LYFTYNRGMTNDDEQGRPLELSERRPSVEDRHRIDAPADSSPRYFHAVEDGSASAWIVARDMTHAVELLSRHDMSDAIHLTVREIEDDHARGVPVTPDDDSPATNLHDAPMGSVYSELY
jgi:hypothetical protein